MPEIIEKLELARKIMENSRQALDYLYKTSDPSEKEKMRGILTEVFNSTSFKEAK